MYQDTTDLELDAYNKIVSVRDDDDYRSPAEELDIKLDKEGYYHKSRMAKDYSFPDNLSAKEYENKIIKKYLMYVLYDNGEVNFEKGNFSEEQKNLIAKVLPIKKIQMSKDLALLVALNPELREAEPENRNFEESFKILRGAASKFPPEDIKYFLDVHSMKYNAEQPTYDKEYVRELNRFSDEINTKTGFSPNYVLSPTSRKKLKNIIDSKKQQDNFNSYLKFRESKGFMDD